MTTLDEPGLARTHRVWDLPVRVFHGLMILCFAGAWLTGDSERWRLLHVTFGLTMAGLVVFRLLWGLVGTRHARFASFVRGPRAVAAYLKSLAAGRPQHHEGHNPAGGWAVLGLLALTALTTAAGWAAYQGWGRGDAVEEVHELAAHALLLAVAVHVVGVVVSSWLHHENLVSAMVTGRKAGLAGEPEVAPWRAVAALLLAAVLGFWALQWRQPPLAGDQHAAHGGTGHEREGGASDHEVDHDD